MINVDQIVRNTNKFAVVLVVLFIIFTGLILFQLYIHNQIKNKLK
jgi:Ni,Fe-hydrogenase I cytochrome b subunit